MNSEQCKNIGLEFENKFYRRCAEYTSLLQQWGKVHNLTAELQDEKIDINILDSIYPLKFLSTDMIINFLTSKSVDAPIE